MEYKTTYTDGYMGSVGYKGENYHLWNYSEKELKRLLLQEFKKNGIKASIRRNRGGWHYSLTITITAEPSDFIEPYDGCPYALNQYYLEREDRFTDAFMEKIVLANDIIRSFNRDNSNAMVDYFDVGFYYSIYVKC